MITTPSSNSFEDILAWLVAMRTPTDDTKATAQALEIIGDFLSQRGMHVQHFSQKGFPSLVATTIANDKESPVLLGGHIDVVPSTLEHFRLIKQNDRYTGRGVMDMKFAIAAYLWLVDQLQRKLADYNFGIMITADEEVGGENGARMLVQKEGFRPKVVIMPDGGENWQIETFAKGVQWIELTAKGRAAHASRPWEGEDAIQKLLSALHDVERLVPRHSKRTDTTLTIGTISGGTAGNRISHHATALLDIRYGSVAEYQQLPPKIDQVCLGHDVTATVLTTSAPCVNDLRNPYIKQFTDIMYDVLGTRYTDSSSFGASDGRYFTEVGIPCIIIEPDAGERHGSGEWISVQGCAQFCTILRRYVDIVGRS